MHQEKLLQKQPSSGGAFDDDAYMALLTEGSARDEVRAKPFADASNRQRSPYRVTFNEDNHNGGGVPNFKTAVRQDYL